jgi:Tfp pilus assembly protein PilP
VRPKRRKKNSTIACVFVLLVGLAFPAGLTVAQSTQETDVNIEKENQNPATSQGKASEGISEKEKAGGEAAEEKAREAYFYNPRNKVDPFKSFIVVRKELEEEMEKEEPRTYLETLDLSQLSLTAIVISMKNRWALVKDSKGEGHVIEIGTPIGRKRGQVVKIMEKEVVVREHDRDFRGNEVINDISLKLVEAD